MSSSWAIVWWAKPTGYENESDQAKWRWLDMHPTCVLLSVSSFSHPFNSPARTNLKVFGAKGKIEDAIYRKSTAVRAVLSFFVHFRLLLWLMLRSKNKDKFQIYTIFKLKFQFYTLFLKKIKSIPLPPPPMVDSEFSRYL
jgi:hypothetical protein